MFKFLLPKQFFINGIETHKNIFENKKGICNLGRFDNGNIIINYFDDETVILDKNYEILYKENTGNIYNLIIINNDQFIGFKDEEMFLFSFIYSNYINSDNPSEPLNQKKIIKIISKLIFKLKEYFLIDIFYDKNNNIFALTMKNEFNEINNFNILVFDVFKNKITLKTKLQILDDYINNFIIFRNEYLIVSKENSLRVFNVNNMKEIVSGINNLNLNDKDNIRGLMNFNKEFLLIFTKKK
jgi:hypothetical protein